MIPRLAEAPTAACRPGDMPAWVGDEGAATLWPLVWAGGACVGAATEETVDVMIEVESVDSEMSVDVDANASPEAEPRDEAPVAAAATADVVATKAEEVGVSTGGRKGILVGGPKLPLPPSVICHIHGGPKGGGPVNGGGWPAIADASIQR